MIGRVADLRQVRCAQSACDREKGIGTRSHIMRWSKPKILEIAVGTEINSYACAAIA
jgi:coenzyme PQQ precursor peptide PqqA